MTKPIIYAGKYEGQESYTLVSGEKVYLRVYNPRTDNRETFFGSVGKDFAKEVESRGFCEIPEIKNGTLLTRMGVEKVDIALLERALVTELAHFSHREFKELKGDVK